MSELFTYRKRIVTSQDVEFLIKLIADNPQKSRNALSIMGDEAGSKNQT